MTVDKHDLSSIFDEHRVGLADGTNLPVTGAARADKLLDDDLPPNELLKRGG
jgi:hypothetical protein